MAECEISVVARYAADVAERLGFAQPELIESQKYDRIDIDVADWTLEDQHAFADLMAQSMGHKGYAVDVWVDRDGLVCVSDKEEEL